MGEWGPERAGRANKREVCGGFAFVRYMDCTRIGIAKEMKMMPRTFLLMSLLACASPAAAQASAGGLTAKLNACHGIRSDLRRLACYDAIAKAGTQTGSPAPKAASASGKWQVTEQTNPLDDSKTSIAFLAADAGRSRLGEPIALVLRCQSGKTEAFAVWSEYLGDDARVTSRVGAAPAETRSWSVSSDNTASFAPKPKTFIRSLLAAKRLVLQVTPYDESPITAVFDLTGVQEAVAPLRTNCGW